MYWITHHRYDTDVLNHTSQVRDVLNHTSQVRHWCTESHITVVALMYHHPVLMYIPVSVRTLYHQVLDDTTKYTTTLMYHQVLDDMDRSHSTVCTSCYNCLHFSCAACALHICSHVCDLFEAGLSGLQVSFPWSQGLWQVSTSLGWIDPSRCCCSRSTGSIPVTVGNSRSSNVESTTAAIINSCCQRFAKESL
jgi:hypothetical protein